MLFGCQRCDTYPKNPEDGHFEVYLSKHLLFERKYLKARRFTQKQFSSDPIL